MNDNTTPHVWVDSLWGTRKESITLKDGEEEITRELSIGMSVKSDNRTQSAILYHKLDEALNRLIEEEKDRWLSAELIRRERTELAESLQDMDELVNGAYALNNGKQREPIGEHPQQTQEPLRQGGTGRLLF